MLRDIYGKKAGCYHKGSDMLKDIVRPLLRNGLLLSEDEFWKTQRGLVSPAFHFSNLKEMVPIVVDTVKETLARWMDATAKEGKATQVEISKEMAGITLNAVATAAFGSAFANSPERAARFTTHLKLVLDMIQYRTLSMIGFTPFLKKLPLPSLRDMKRGVTVVHSIVEEIVQARKEGKSHAVGGRASP